MTPFEHALVSLYNTERDALLRYAHSRFPGLDAGRHEDALSQSFLDALSRPSIRRAWQRCPDPEGRRAMLRRTFRTVLWRHLRGEWRRRDTRSLSRAEQLPEAADTTTPERRVAAARHIHRLAAEEDAAFVELLYTGLRAGEAQVQARTEAVIASVSGREPWVRCALNAYVDSSGSASKSELSRRFGSHLRSARSILSRKVKRLEQAFPADPGLRVALGVA